MTRTLFALAFHAYTLAALGYLGYLARPWRALLLGARTFTGIGLVLHGAGLFGVLSSQGGMPLGMGQGLSIVVFVLFALGLTLDLTRGIPVLGAFLMPAALAGWVPGLWLGGGSEPLSPAVRQPLLPVHITVALVGMAACAAAALVGAVYLLMERQVKGKRFGLLFSRLPSLSVLDDLNRKLVVTGFIALSMTLVTGAFFVTGRPFWAWQAKEVGTVVAWGLFGGLVFARMIAGWRGRRVVLLSMAGFCVVVMSFLSSYGAGLGWRGWL